MSTKVFLFILVTSFSIKAHAQFSEVAEGCYKALKTKSIKPLTQYFLNTEQSIKILSWPNTQSTINLVDSINQSYKDSLISCFHEIDLNLKEKGFNLKKSKLIKSERSFGVFGQMTLFLSYGKKTTSIFIDVMDVNEKDYLFGSYPSEIRPNIPKRGMLIRVNNISYPIWHLRNSELEKAKSIVRKAEPIEVEGKQYLNYKWIGLTHGIITTEGKYYVHTKAFRNDNLTKVNIFIDLEIEKIVKIEKELPAQKMKIITSSSKEETYVLLEKKHNKKLAEKFLELRAERIKFENFIDSLREELVSQSGGYIEKDGRKIPKGKRDKEIPNRLFILEGKGKELEQKILFLEEKNLSLIKDVTIKESIRDELPLKINSDGLNERKWAEYMFGHMPLAAIFPMLRKFQNDAKTSEAIIINYLLNGE